MSAPPRPPPPTHTQHPPSPTPLTPPRTGRSDDIGFDRELLRVLVPSARSAQDSARTNNTSTTEGNKRATADDAPDQQPAWEPGQGQHPGGLKARATAGPPWAAPMTRKQGGADTGRTIDKDVEEEDDTIPRSSSPELNRRAEPAEQHSRGGYSQAHSAGPGHQSYSHAPELRALPRLSRLQLDTLGLAVAGGDPRRSQQLTSRLTHRTRNRLIEAQPSGGVRAHALSSGG